MLTFSCFAKPCVGRLTIMLSFHELREDSANAVAIYPLSLS